MEITDFTIRILILLIPGLITYLIVNKFTDSKKDNIIVEVTKVIIYSFISYSISALGGVILENIFPCLDLSVNFLNCLTDSSIPVSWVEIIITAFLSIFVGCIISKLINQSFFHKTAQRFNITKKFSDLDVWSYLFNSKNNFYIVIRDIENNLTYQGYPQAFSKDHKECEVLLINVRVYRYKDSKLLYKCDSMYYKFNSEKINFEIQLLEEENSGKK